MDQINPYQTPNSEIITFSDNFRPGVELAKRLAAFISIIILFLSQGVVLPQGIVVSIMIVSQLSLEQNHWLVAEFLSFYTISCLLLWLLYRNFRVLFGLGWAAQDGSSIRYYLPGKWFWLISLSVPLMAWIYINMVSAIAF